MFDTSDMLVSARLPTVIPPLSPCGHTAAVSSSRTLVSAEVGSLGCHWGRLKMATKPQHEAPRGMEPYDLGGENDLGALSEEQQSKLNDFKIKTRTENEQYLRKHPEVDCLISGFLSSVLLQQPGNVREFAADYFTAPTLPDKVKEQLEERKQSLQMNKVLKQMH